MTAPLQINGWSVPVAAPSASRGEESIGTIERTVNGRLSRTRSALLDTYEGMLALSDGELARAFRALVQGRGHRLDCESLYTSKALLPAGSAALRASGAVIDSGGTSRTDPKFGGYCLALEAAVTNLLTQNVRTGTDSGGVTTGFEASVAGVAGGAATISSSATVAWQGTKSLKTVTTAVADQGFRTTVIAVAGTLVAGSVYVRASAGTPQVKVFLYDNTAGTAGTKTTVTLSATAWQRVEVVAVGAGAGHNWCLCVEQVAAGIMTYYCDGFQLEAGIFASNWIGAAAGATQTQAAANLSYPLREMKARDDFAFACWSRQPVQTGGATSRLFTLGTEADGIRCYVVGPGAAGATVYVDSYVGGAQVGQALLQDAFDDGAWHHVAVTIRRDPQSGSFSIEIYYDGVCPFDGNANVTCTLPVTGAAPTLYLGTDAAGTTPWGALVDEVLILPWAPTLAMVLAWSSRVFSDLPELLVCGSHLGTTTAGEAAYIGEVTGHSLTLGQLGGVWRADAATVGFRLREVG